MKKSTTILITGASGKSGGEAARSLLNQGFKVRAMVRVKDNRSKALQDDGAEIVVGDMQSAKDLSIAMKGVQRAYFVCPWTQNQLDMALNFAVAAEEHKVEHIVVMSQWLASPAHPSVATRRTYLVDRMLSWLPNTTWTMINVGFFADNYMALLEPISQLGLLPLPLGNGLNAPVSNGDIGRCVAAALMDPAKHAGRVYRPCGPKLLSPSQIAEGFGEALGRKVSFQNISEKMFLKATTSLGLPLGLICQLRYYFEDYRQGAFAAGAPNDAVRHLTGQEPESFTAIVRQYIQSGRKHDAPANSMEMELAFQPSVSNKALAVRNFAKLLLTKAPKPEVYEQEQETPQLREPFYAMQYGPWKNTHTIAGAFGSTPNPLTDGIDILLP